MEDVEERVKAAITLLGNASSQLSALRRLKVIEEYDKDLMSFCQSFKNYQSEAPALFGAEFREKALQHLTQVRELRKAKSSKPQSFYKAPFQGHNGNRGGRRNNYPLQRRYSPYNSRGGHSSQMGRGGHNLKTKSKS